MTLEAFYTTAAGLCFGLPGLRWMLDKNLIRNGELAALDIRMWI